MTTNRTAPRVDVHLTSGDLLETMRVDVSAGLARRPKELPPKYFYDARGSELFDQITRLPEYYPTRTERMILESSAEQVAKLAEADTLVELGSGSSEKTRLLLDGLDRAGHLRRYVPVDVSESALTGALDRLSTDYPRLELHGVVADFERHLEQIPSGGTRMVAFLGSTIGNLARSPRHEFLAAIRLRLAPGDTLLLGTDLVKDPDRLVAAYDDAAGVTAEFNRNVLRVLNRELGADFEPDDFEHVARWNRAERQMEMWLRARRGHRVRLTRLGLSFPFEAAEEMRTEISAKFTPQQVHEELAAAGFDVAGWWTDPDADFAVSLARPSANRGAAGRATG